MLNEFAAEIAATWLASGIDHSDALTIRDFQCIHIPKLIKRERLLNEGKRVIWDDSDRLELLLLTTISCNGTVKGLDVNYTDSELQSSEDALRSDIESGLSEELISVY